MVYYVDISVTKVQWKIAYSKCTYPLPEIVLYCLYNLCVKNAEVNQLSSMTIKTNELASELKDYGTFVHEKALK